MKLKNLKITNRGLYWGLIITFGLLYACVGFVSTLHSITFFQLANNLGLAILLGITYEIGQASVLFSILMSEKNKGKFLPWSLMVLLTALQVTANVYASFKFMSGTGNTDWTYWQKSILFGVQASSPEMYQVIISWIAGALLPIVALGMTALVAQNMTFMKEENEQDEKPKDSKEPVQEFLNYEFKTPEPEEMKVEPEAPTKKEIDEIIENEVQKRMAEIPLETIVQKYNDLQKTINEYKEQNNPEDNEISTIIDTPLNEFDIHTKFESGGTPEPELKKAAEEATNTMSERDFLDEEAERLIDIHNANIMTGKYEQKFPGLSETVNEINKEVNAEETPLLEQEFQKDFITPEPPKKRGRPPKQTDNVVELKKAQEPLQKEEVKVPQKPKRSVNPLKRKSKKIKPLKSLKEINKPSKGDEVIALLEKMEKEKQKESITPLVENEPESQDSILVPPEIKDDNFASYIMNGVEVIDAKAVPVKKNE